MPDVELFDFWNGRDRADVSNRQAVTRMSSETGFRTCSRGDPEVVERGCVVWIVCVLPGVEFHRMCANFFRNADCIHARVDEEAHTYSGFLQSPDGGLDAGSLACDVETAFCRDLRSLFRNKSHLPGFETKSNV